MHVKKIALGVLLMTSLVGAPMISGGGCGGSGGDTGGSGGDTGGGGGTDTTLDPVCSGTNDPGDEADITWTVTSLVIPNPETDSEIAGFNLDGLNTTGASAADPTVTGCGINDFENDFEDGVDNGLAYLSPVLNLAASQSGGYDDINDAMQTSINAGELVITITVSGYNGTGDDECVTVSMVTGDFGEQVADAEGRVDDSILTVTLTEFGLKIPASDGLTADVNVYDGRLLLDLGTGSGMVGGILDRGGADFAVAEAEEAEEGTLHRAIAAIASSLEGLGGSTGLDGFVDGALDKGTDSDAPNGDACTALSVGLGIQASSD